MSPRVYLVSRPSFDVAAFLAFLAEEGLTWDRSAAAHDSEEIVEAAGRICYQSFGTQQSPRTNTEYIAHLVEMGHDSVLEHVSWSFVLVGVSRAFSHQLVRHRNGFAFSQLSQQYHEERNADFIEPSYLAVIPEARAVWRRAVSASQDAYREILDSLLEHRSLLRIDDAKELRRAIRSAARSVLPNATETQFFLTANARALRHFLRVRGAIGGDEEMRQVSAALLRLLKIESPALFADYTTESLDDGSPIVLHRRPVEFK